MHAWGIYEKVGWVTKKYKNELGPKQKHGVFLYVSSAIANV